MVTAKLLVKENGDLELPRRPRRRVHVRKLLDFGSFRSQPLVLEAAIPADLRYSRRVGGPTR